MSILRNLIKPPADDSRGVPARPAAASNPADRLAEVASLSAAGQHAEAYRLVNEALRTEPGDLEFGFARASILMGWGRLREALAEYLRLESSGLSHVTLYRQLAITCAQLSNPVAAESWARKVVAVDPRDADGNFVLGTTLQAQKRYAEAISSYERTLLTRPEDFDCLINLGYCALDEDQPASAEAYFRRAIDVHAARAIAWTNLGVSLDAQDRHDEALIALEHAMKLDPERTQAPDIAFNLAVGLLNGGRIDAAIATYESTLRDRPVPKGQYGYGEALLTAGRLEEGFAHYESRWMKGTHLALRTRLTQPRWSGQDLRGKRILLIAEQGIGDTFQFIRYARMVKSLGARVLVRARTPLRGLIETATGVDEVSYDGEPIPEFHYYIHLMSLPAAFGTRLDTIPADVPYLSARADKLERWSGHLRASGLARVGLVWAGNPEHARDRYRSIPLEHLAALQSLRGVRFFSLQKNQKGDAHPALPAELDCIDLGPLLNDFADTAAVISQLDLVISVDTAVAHLAGALGRNTFLLLPDPPEWRWLLAREDSPWYPTVRLFRQQRRGDWSGTIELVRDALQKGLVDGRVTLPVKSCPVTGAAEVGEPQQLPDWRRDYHGFAAVAETDLGILQYFPDEGQVGESISCYGEYLQRQLDLLGHLVVPGATVVEVGAGAGFHALFLSRAVATDGHLLLYEARPSMQWVLRNNIGANRLENVTVMRRALGRPSGPAGAQGPASESLDELCLERLDWLKTGMGVNLLEILQGAQQTLWSLRPSLFAACSEAQMLDEAAVATREFGYRCWRFETPLFNPQNFYRRERDIFGGRCALALVATPEEAELDLAPLGCVEIE